MIGKTFTDTEKNKKTTKCNADSDWVWQPSNKCGLWVPFAFSLLFCIIRNRSVGISDAQAIS